MSELPKRSRILAIGSAFPDQVVTNADLEKIVDTNDQWIRERTGIQERRKLREGQNNSDIAAEAALKALKKAGKTPMDVDLIIGCTNSPDRWMPSLAATVQAKIGAHNNSAAYDIITACAGWVTGMQVADSFVRAGQYKCVLVLGSEALSRFINWKDRGTCVLFGDGAGVALVGPGNPGDSGEILELRVHADGRFGDVLDMPGGGSRCPTSAEVVEKSMQFIHMNGQEVFKHAVKNMASVCEEVLANQKIDMSEVDWLIPHQANIRIIDAVGKRLGFSPDKTALNVHKYGNTSTATIPTCIDEYAEAGKIKKGQLLLITSFGGGLSWAGGLIRW